MKKNNRFVGVFNILIVAIFFLSVSACGYKAAPFYSEDTPVSDKNVEFILQKKSSESNESCEK